MLKKFVVAAAVACLLAGPALAGGGGEVRYTPRFNVPESAVLDGLSFRAVVMKTVSVRNGQPLEQEKLSFEPELLAWVREAMDKMGFRVTGNDADPLFALHVQCSDDGCRVNSGIRRDTYLLRVEGGRQYFLKIPDRSVAEYFGGADVGPQFSDGEVAQRDAAFRALRAALQDMATHVSEANSPEALAQYKRLFETEVAPQGAASKAARKKAAAR